MRLNAIGAVLQAYLAARWRSLRLRTPQAVTAYQQRQLRRLTARATRELPFYHRYVGQPFASLPIIDKAALLANFAAMNRAGLDLAAVRQALALGSERLDGRIVGMSTGTTGNRGYYVISEAERFVWLGTILAKALPGALWRKHRVALALPALSDLYSSATRGSRITLQFFDLAAGPEAWIDRLVRFAPDTIVAPPKVLRWLAERGELKAAQIFSGAEVLDPLDRQLIERATGRKVREIYMATEGLFAVSCEHGTLHLAEDVVHFEFDRPDPNGPLVSPIVTDFTRREQGMIRYRMNDLFELSERPCPCRSAYRAVKRIEGRSDDAFLLADGAGTYHLVTPDILRNAVVDADRGIDDFRIVQTGPAAIAVSLPEGLPHAVDEKVRAGLDAALARRGLAAEIVMKRGIALDFTRKLRRVQRDWRGPDQG
jgi:putative adenylate-forming enzyme